MLVKKVIFYDKSVIRVPFHSKSVKSVPFKMVSFWTQRSLKLGLLLFFHALGQWSVSVYEI